MAYLMTHCPFNIGHKNITINDVAKKTFLQKTYVRCSLDYVTCIHQCTLFLELLSQIGLFVVLS